MYCTKKKQFYNKMWIVILCKSYLAFMYKGTRGVSQAHKASNLLLSHIDIQKKKMTNAINDQRTKILV